jgi:hypothetical protein
VGRGVFFRHLPSAICHLPSRVRRHVYAMLYCPCVHLPLPSPYTRPPHPYPARSRPSPSDPRGAALPKPHTYLPTLFSGSASPPLFPCFSPSFPPNTARSAVTTELLISPAISTYLCRTRTAPVTAPAGIVYTFLSLCRCCFLSHCMPI